MVVHAVNDECYVGGVSPFSAGVNAISTPPASTGRKAEPSESTRGPAQAGGAWFNSKQRRRTPPGLDIPTTAASR